MLKFDIFRKKINEMSSGGAGGGIANVAGSGAIAGLGVGSQGEPPGPKAVMSRLRRKKLEQVNEVFSKIQSYKWTVHGPEVHQAEFSVKKDDKIRVTFKKLDFSKNDWEVDFARSNIDTKHDFTTARLSTGFSYEIFSTVFEIIKDFVKDARPHSLWITGIEKGGKADSRTKLYDTMTKLLPQKIGYKLTHRQDLGGSVVWVLEPKQKLTEETFAGHKVFKVKSEYYHRCRMGKRKFLRYEKYVGNDEFGEEIRKYGRKNYNTAIIVQDESTGAMVYLRRERKL